MRFFSQLILCWLGLVLLIGASPSDTLQVEDILNGDQMGNLTFSPDGEWVMYINRAVDVKENKRLGQVFLQQWNRQAKPVRLTDEKFSAIKALFSPDGKQVAVLGKSSDQ
ncbi:MAG: PD40 domain-containing protein, partial [Candidatus Delongbacteria bacterium]|nr:PD40 domain-containing protein [Candidatus Delongbacteria bacterium]